jgi:UPF0755 protein
MALRNGGRARSASGSPGARSGDPSAKRPIVDTGWSDYNPEQTAASTEAGKGRAGQADPQRDYRSSRSGGFGTVARFAVFAVVAAALVLGGLFFVAKPVVSSSLANWAAENPTALKLPFVADVVRSELGTKLTQPVNAADSTKVAFQITAGETPKQIADELLQAGLISDAKAFVFESLVKDVSSQFISGRHVLTKSMTVDQIISVLIAAPTAPPSVTVTFVEGDRIEQVVAVMELKEANPADPDARLSLDVNQFYQLATHPPASLVAKYSWLKLPQGASLEGFLFPATYTVKPDVTAEQFLIDMLDAFAANAPAELLALPPDQIYQTVTLASIVEKEGSVADELSKIAGVYTNRLDAKLWPTDLLEADPTVAYASDSVWAASHPIADWSTHVWFEAVHAPQYSKLSFPGFDAYNTYKTQGMPPTPIASPGAAAMRAALAPDTADKYLFFLAIPGTKTHVFEKTQAEHDANRKKYGYT